MQPMATRNPVKRAPKPKPTRRYTNTRRTAQAAQTRADVLAAAVECFDELGWGATTIAAIAERAGVAVETIYSGFGSKKRLLQQAVDVTVVGDAEPVAFWDRPEVRALGEGELRDRVARGLAIVAAQHARGARVIRAAVEAAAGDDEMEAWRAEKVESRRLDTSRTLELIFGTNINPVTIELLLALYSAETYLFLTEDSGWTAEEYQQHLVEASFAIIRIRHPEL
jgi:AcrR family transcriptional regulator